MMTGDKSREMSFDEVGKKQRVLFVAATGHSGSTLLEMLIEGGRFVGLGEVYQLVIPGNKMLDNLQDQYCSCGAGINECEFWGQVVPMLKRNKGTVPRETYGKVLELAYGHFGAEKTLVDSSKMPNALKTMVEVDGLDIRVIHLVRDFRGWLVSRRNSYLRHGVKKLGGNIRKFGLKGVYRYFQRFRVVDAYHWLSENERIQRVASEHALPVLTVTYEGLCLDQDRELARISEFIGDEVLPDMKGESSRSHNVFGNRMRFDEKKLAAIKYDHQWFYRSDWLWVYALYPGLARANERIMKGSRR